MHVFFLGGKEGGKKKTAKHTSRSEVLGQEIPFPRLSIASSPCYLAEPWKHLQSISVNSVRVLFVAAVRCKLYVAVAGVAAAGGRVGKLHGNSGRMNGHAANFPIWGLKLRFLQRSFFCCNGRLALSVLAQDNPFHGRASQQKPSYTHQRKKSLTYRMFPKAR
jgi:hypothetical protein